MPIGRCVARPWSIALLLVLGSADAHQSAPKGSLMLA